MLALGFRRIRRIPDVFRLQFDFVRCRCRCHVRCRNRFRQRLMLVTCKCLCQFHQPAALLRIWNARLECALGLVAAVGSATSVRFRKWRSRQRHAADPIRLHWSANRLQVACDKRAKLLRQAVHHERVFCEKKCSSFNKSM